MREKEDALNSAKVRMMRFIINEVLWFEESLVGEIPDGSIGQDSDAMTPIRNGEMIFYLLREWIPFVFRHHGSARRLYRC